MIRAALSEAESPLRRGFLDKQLRRSVWIDANSLRVHITRIAITLHYLSSSGKADATAELFCTVLALAKVLRRYVKHAETLFRIHQIITTAHTVAADDAVAKPEQASIWMTRSRADPGRYAWETESKGDPKPSQGSLYELVYHLTSDINFEREYQLTFISTYRSFTDPHTLFDMLMDRFVVPDGLFSPQRTKTLQLRVAVVVSNWVSTNFQDFDHILLDRLHEFSQKLLALGYKTAAEGLIGCLKKMHRNASLATIASPPLHFETPADCISPTAILLASSELEIARQLTLIDYTIFSSIEVSEMLNLNWSSKSRVHRAPNVRMMVGRLNQLSHWFASMLLWTADASARAKLYAKVLRILQYLHELHNYNAVMAIVVGFNLAAVPRLKKTIALVDPQLVDAFHEIEALMSPTGSYKAYREALRSISGPVIPYIGLFLADLTFIEEGNPDRIDDLINFEKPNLIGKILRDLRTFQSNPYPFPPIEPLHSLLFALPHVQNEKYQFDLSLEIEPRQARS